jgi:valine dehydrogenase (NAD+)
LLGRRGITWVPDFVANAGGLIQVAGELHGTDRSAVEADVTRIFDRCRDIIATARQADISIGAAANLFAEQRLDGAV